LPFQECLRLLASVPVGRVGFFADGEMVILPVNHAVDGQDLVFRTTRGTKLSAAEGQNLVAFEADDYDQQTRSGWSVLVNGRAEVVDDAADVRRLSHLGLHAWVLHAWATAVERPVWIRIRPASVSGRRVPAIR
jgi:nitroimidazol reductase NimA-like FMN-containing flavoprotein (pyridoxamine 5'-phosphate oxidase superfamily)